MDLERRYRLRIARRLTWVALVVFLAGFIIVGLEAAGYVARPDKNGILTEEDEGWMLLGAASMFCCSGPAFVVLVGSAAVAWRLQRQEIAEKQE